GQAPFKEVVTHGFLVDARTGDKLSKSGFLIAVDEVVSKIGAELLRLWIAGIDFTDDLPMSWEILKERAEPYKKIRNTFRYILGAIHDFDPSKDAVKDLLDVDRWALAELAALEKRVTQHYENYQFFRAYQELYQFCNVEMSAVYFDVLKDRLYTSGKNSRERRSGQTVLHQILVALTKMFAPMICHTAEEVWGYLPARETESVHLSAWPEPPAVEKDPKWERIFEVRAEVQRGHDRQVARSEGEAVGRRRRNPAGADVGRPHVGPDRLRSGDRERRRRGAQDPGREVDPSEVRPVLEPEG